MNGAVHAFAKQNGADKTAGAPGDFISSLELAPSLAAPAPSASAVQLDSGFAANIHCPSPLPSGF